MVVAVMAVVGWLKVHVGLHVGGGSCNSANMTKQLMPQLRHIALTHERTPSQGRIRGMLR